MKCICKYLLVFALGTSLASCSDFLDMTPDEVLTLDDVFNNRIYTRNFLTHIYSWTPTEANMADSGGAWRNPYTGGCDEMEIAFGGAYSHQINNGGWNPSNIKDTQVWPESYMAIRKVNQFLENVDRCPTSDTEKNHWKGEAYFLRAWFHFLAFRAYGPIPLLDHSLDPSEDMLSIRRSPADQCAKFIAEDCMRAYELLKDRPYVDKVTSDGDLGRATSMAALGLRSRVLLYIASPLYNGNTDMASFRDVDGTPLISQTYDPEKWNEAAKAARLCLDEAAASGYVRLYERDSDPVTNYQNIFNQNWNEEILWAKNIGTYDHWENCCNPISFGCFSIINPTQEMVDAYEMADGSTPITGYTDNGLTPIINPESGYVEEGFTDTEYENRWQKGVSNMYVNREPHFYASINFAGAIWLTSRASNWTEPHTLEFWYTGVDGKNNAGSDYCKTGYLMKKLIYPTVIPFQSYPVQQWVYIRLGEIYLNYAEALNEYGGPTSEVYNAVNEIRNRAGLPDLPTGLSPEQMRERIKHERRIELAFEVHRFFDVRRWKDAEHTENQPVHSMNIMEGTHMQDPAYYKRVQIEERVFEAPKHYFFPVDQVEIDKRPQYLVQSPGWTTPTSGD